MFFHLALPPKISGFRLIPPQTPPAMHLAGKLVAHLQCVDCRLFQYARYERYSHRRERFGIETAKTQSGRRPPVSDRADLVENHRGEVVSQQPVAIGRQMNPGSELGSRPALFEYPVDRRVRLERSEAEAAERYARSRGVSLSEVIRRALRTYLKGRSRR